MQMKRRTFLGATMGTVAAMGLAACGASGGADTGNKAITGTYAINAGGYDWGASVDKAILTFDAPLDAIAASDFLVTETRQDVDFSADGWPTVEMTFDREVTDAYLCDADGNKADGPSNTVVLDLAVAPNIGAPLAFHMDTQFCTWSDPYYLTFALAEGAALTSEGNAVASVEVAQDYTARTTAADIFEKDSFTSESGVTIEYATYKPEEESDALLVWLHGMGEGGGQVTGATDAYVPLLGGKVTALASDSLQGKAPINILAPQCPTVWSDIDGQMSNFQGGIDLRDDCYYREPLAELIDSYAQSIGAQKIVIAGCSAGGYMTMNLAVHYQDKYTAYVPICEAYKDAYITDEQIAGLSKVPMFFIHSANDETVLGSENCLPTIKRLEDAGAEDLHHFISDTVVDTSGLYTNEDGTPYEYNGHFAWVYFHNNEADCDECGIPVFDWIVEQVA